MRVVVDSNVLIAGLAAEGVCRDIVKRRLSTCELFTSRVLLDELAEKLRVKFGLNPNDLPLLQIYADEAAVINPTSLPKPFCRDTDDDEVLATALAANAEIILTGDKDLLVLQEFQGIKIVTPRQFVELLDRAK